MRTITEWQKAAYACAREHGFHDCRVCGADMCSTPGVNCPACNGTGLAPMTPTRIGARLAAIHSEIAEAYQCVARGRMELYWLAPDGTSMPPQPGEFSALQGASYTAFLRSQGCKPEGFGIELADVFLRLCALAEALGVQLWPTNDSTIYDTSSTEQVASNLNRLHELLSYDETASGDRYRVELSLSTVYHRLWTIAYSHHIDLLAMAELKHAYNLTRPRMHGKVL